MFPRVLFPTAFAVAAAAAAASAYGEDPEAPPVCISGGPYAAECAGPVTLIPVDGSASYDPNGTTVTFRWLEECDWGHFDDPTNPIANFVYENDGTCQRLCEFNLRVTSGGQSVTCGQVITLADTTPPVLAVPADVTAIWGLVATEPASLGTAVAVDACDYVNGPTVNYYDSITPQQGPGHEQTIKRTWVASDRCENVAHEVQTITLLSPANNCKNLEIDLSNCPDIVDRGGASTLSIHVLGKTGTQATALNPATLKLARLGDQINHVYPFATYAPVDAGRFLAANYGDCNVPGTDGRKDMRLDFDRLTVISVLGLDDVNPGDPVYVMVTGQRWNGTPFFAATMLTVQ